MKNFSFQTRAENLKKLSEEEFDILIIGGGITGAGTARDASLRGLKVALVEAEDFAFGTSSRSSKLVHGGIRYLENLDFKLVFEALAERSILFKMAPHLAHPLRFVIPLYKNSRVGMFKMGLGMMLYDLLALFKTPRMHQRLSVRTTSSKYSVLNSKDLIGAYEYSDGYMEDSRLVYENLRAANENNAIMANYVRVLKRDLNDGFQNITCEDQITKVSFSIKAKHIISTVGPWTDLVGDDLVASWKKILRPTKGVHLTFSKKRIQLSSALVMAAEKSSRIVFAIPRHEMVIVGTTDTDFNQHPETVKVEKEDVNYLLNISNQYFPGAQLTEDDIISSYAGVRPLVNDDSDSEGKTSREHRILHLPSNISFVAGGKYTTYRRMSEEIVDQVIEKYFKSQLSQFKKCETKSPLNIFTSVEAYQKALSDTFYDAEKPQTLDGQLAFRYGEEYKIIKNKFQNYKNYWQLEAAQAIHTTMCLNLVDFYSRRVPLFLSMSDHGQTLLNEIATIFKDELHLTDTEIEQQKSDLINYIKNELSWRE